MGTNPASPTPMDTWASGAAYEPYVGRWSRLVAREFLPWLVVPAGRRWLDVGCGTGALSQTILELASPRFVHGVDPSQGYVHFIREKTQDARAIFSVGDAQALQLDAGSYDATVSGLVLNFIREKQQALAEMARVTRPGGIVALYVWDYAGAMQLMRHFWDAAVALDPAAFDLDEGRRFPICKPEPLMNLFESAGLQDVEVRAIDVPTVFQNFDDYWFPFLGGQGPAPSYAMSLSEERRTALQNHIHDRLPIAQDGSISLVARAWAVRGVR
jgi:SAM-dependent methyltransferase